MIFVTTIAEYITGLKAAGIFDFYLPFFILFAIFYALLLKSGIFGEPEERLPRKISLIIALGASAYVMIYTPIGGMLTLGQYLGTLFGQTFIVIMSILAVLIIGYVLLVPLGIGMEVEKGKVAAKLIVSFLIILGIGLFISSGGLTFFLGTWPTTPTIILPSLSLTLEDLAIISLVVLTGLVIYWLTAGPKLTPEERRKIAEEEVRKAAAARGG